MPNMRIDNLKDKTSREASQLYQSDLKLKNMTTREWDYAAERGSKGASDESIRKEILKNRKR